MILDLLINLYKVYALTGREWPIIQYILGYIEKYIPEAKVVLDNLGNLYITKGDGRNGYPTLICHLDQVQIVHSEDFEVKQNGNLLYGWSEANQQREGLGADDKNGIWICLRCLEECTNLKVFMAVGEEKGCIGSNRADMSFFEDSLYLLEPDCKGGEEIHTVLRGIPCASDDFVASLKAETNGYIITEGKTSDILALTLNDIGISCANIPAGYYQPHKDDEFTNISELLHSYNYIKETIQRLNTRYSHHYRSETQQWVENLKKQTNNKK